MSRAMWLVKASWSCSEALRIYRVPWVADAACVSSVCRTGSCGMVIDRCVGAFAIGRFEGRCPRIIFSGVCVCVVRYDRKRSVTARNGNVLRIGRSSRRVVGLRVVYVYEFEFEFDFKFDFKFVRAQV